jgi:hypothetical protein
LVEAVGIEEVATHPVTRIDGGISWTNGVGRPAKSPFEPGLGDDLGTNVPRILTQDELLAKIRAALDARIISDDYAQTLIELVDVISAFEPKT